MKSANKLIELAMIILSEVTLVQKIKCLLAFCFLLSVDLEPLLELALVYQAGLKLSEIGLPLPPEC